MTSLLSAGTYEDDTSIYLGLKVLPPSGGTSHKFHLALLIDTSGSMDGERIDAVKRTLHLLVDKLADDNKLTLIGYNSAATVLVNNYTISEATREPLKVQIDTLNADGGTNLEVAFAALRDVPDVDSAFLLTDGHINQGITSRSGLLRIFNASVAYGTPVNTLGYGADHDSSALKFMALNTCGSYTFADAAELIPAIIGDIIGGLATTVGRCAKVYIPEGWTCCELAPTQEDKYSIGSLIANKPQYVLLKAPKGTDLPAGLVLRYTAGTAPMMAVVNNFRALSAIDVAVQRDRCAVATAFAAATEHLEQFHQEEARRCLVAVGELLAGSIAKDTPMVIQLRAQVDDMLDALKPPPPPQWGPGYPMSPQLGGHSAYSGIAPPPLAPLLSRMASNTAALGLQRGFLTVTSPPRPDGSRTPSTVHHTFSSEEQQTQSVDMTTRYVEDQENA
jgi:hypothetical protein